MKLQLYSSEKVVLNIVSHMAPCTMITIQSGKRLRIKRSINKHLDYAFAYIENLTIPRLQLPSVRLIIVHVFAPRIYFSRKFILKVTILKDLCMMAPRAFLKARKEYCIDRSRLQTRQSSTTATKVQRISTVSRRLCSQYSSIKSWDLLTGLFTAEK